MLSSHFYFISASVSLHKVYEELCVDILLKLKFNLSRVPTSPPRHSYHTSSSFHLHRINPELIGAPVHVSNGYQHGQWPDQLRTNSTNEHPSFVLEMDEIIGLNSAQQEEGDSERGRFPSHP